MKRKIKEFLPGAALPVEREYEIEFPYEPTFDNIVVVPFEEEDKSSGGIIIPDAAKRTLNQGEVLKIGKLCKFAKVGMTVIFQLHTEAKVTVDRTSFAIVNESNILTFSEKVNEKKELDNNPKA